MPERAPVREVRVDGRKPTPPSYFGTQDGWGPWRQLTALHPRADSAVAEGIARRFVSGPGDREARVVVTYRELSDA